MNQKLETKIFEKFPDLYKDHKLTEQESPMAFGIECDDGWFDIIWILSQSIQNRLDWTNRLFPELQLSIRAVQVKEKWGGLRYYTDISYRDSPTEEEMRQINRLIDTVSGMVVFAESLSHSICERCGGKGSLNKGPWYKTLCSQCDHDKATQNESPVKEYGGMPSVPDQIGKP